MNKLLFAILVMTASVTHVTTIKSFEFMPVQSIPICIAQTILETPSATSDLIYIERIAWSVGTTVLPEPLMANGQEPQNQEPELICMGGCSQPPCFPVSSCSLSDLFWSSRYMNLSAMQNFHIQLSDMPVGLVPSRLLVVYDTEVPSSATVSPSPSPTPSVTVSPTPSVTVTISPTPSVTETLSPQPGIRATPLQEGTESKTATITLGVLLGVVQIPLIVGWYKAFHPSCAYCQISVPSKEMRDHLKTCLSHLSSIEFKQSQPHIQSRNRQQPDQELIIDMEDNVPGTVV